MHYNLIKATNKRYLEEVLNRWQEFPVLHKAINVIQKTEWQINKQIFDVINYCFENNLSIGNLPVTIDEDEFEPCPPFEKKTDEVFIQWKRRKSQWHTEKSKMMSRWIQLKLVLTEAKEFLGESGFYYPYQYDFRTRIYPKPSQLSPQSSDFSRALLKFKLGKPMGSDDAFVKFAIAGAGLHGETDKQKLINRTQWVMDNNDSIMKSATDPLNETWWRDADKPFCFLAWCFEYKAFADTDFSPDFVTTLPIQMDCSNSGLQHYSAIMRDSYGGKATNLLPSEQPNDIYNLVAEKVKMKLRDMKDNEFAVKWLEYGIDRKICKKPVMCLPYSLSRFSCRQYIEDHVVKEKNERNKQHNFGKDLFKATNFLTPIVWDSINSIITSAKQIMTFLKDISALASKENLPVCWTTPVGVPIQMMTYKRKSKRVKTKMGDTIVKLSVQSDTKEIDRRRTAQSVCANYIHSLDASLLQIATVKAFEKGVDNFSMIHDSFGCVAPDAQLFSDAIRDSFVEMYQEDVLANFAREIYQMLSDKNKAKFPNMPAKGNLDLEEVRKSTFFCI